MRTLLLFLAYNGTRYHGYQVQKNAVTVAETFQNALERVLGERPDIKGCSRTDAGVHANHFAVSFPTKSQIPCQALVRALNANLPPDIAALQCREVEAGFHARYRCTGKRYLYRVRNSRIKNPFAQSLELLYPTHLDEVLLDRAAKAFLGRHDFSGFCSAGSSVEDRVRTLYDFTVKREGELVTFSVTGDGFLYNMVRILVGTLFSVNAGQISPEELPAILESGNRSRAGATVPPQGLYLDEVFYDPLPAALTPSKKEETL